jgi:citrate synthase
VAETAARDVTKQELMDSADINKTKLNEATINIDGKDVLTVPIVTGTEGETALDITRLRADTGLITLDAGYGNTAETNSEVTYLNGEEGILRYRGYPIEQLAEQSSFLEVAYLLYEGHLPNAEELDNYTAMITKHTLLREDMRHLFEAFPNAAHPMQKLASATSALGTYYPDMLDPLDLEAARISSIRLIAKMPTITAWAYKHSVNQPYIYPRNELGYAANFLHMMFKLPVQDLEISPAMAKALDVLFILHADHGQNLSASAVRLVGSGHADVFSSVASGIHALSGPLHGGANERVVNMLEDMLANGGDTKSYLERAKDRNDPFRLMGFGHRVYRNFDPRSGLIKKYAQRILDEMGSSDPLLEMATQLEEEALADDYFAERKLYPNVDYYSGIIYRAMGFPLEMFTVLFVLGRLAGWLAQWREMISDPDSRLQRPRQVYTGSPIRDYVPVDDR